MLRPPPVQLLSILLLVFVRSSTVQFVALMAGLTQMIARQDVRDRESLVRECAPVILQQLHVSAWQNTVQFVALMDWTMITIAGPIVKMR